MTKSVEEIKEEIRIATITTTEELILKLNRESNGSNIHSINKAIFYLQHFENNPEHRFIHNGKTDRLLFLKCDVLKALKTKNWIELSKGWLSSWW